MKQLMNLTAGILLSSVCTAQLADSPEDLDRFGAVLATGDFNKDGYGAITLRNSFSARGTEQPNPREPISIIFGES